MRIPRSAAALALFSGGTLDLGGVGPTGQNVTMRFAMHGLAAVSTFAVSYLASLPEPSLLWLLVALATVLGWRNARR